MNRDDSPDMASDAPPELATGESATASVAPSEPAPTLGDESTQPGPVTPAEPPSAGASDGDGDGVDLASEVSRLTDALARTQAEFANYRKRIAREGAAAAERTKATVLEALVPVLDAFDAAAAHDDSTSTAAPLRGALVEATKRMGLVAVLPDPGDRFDPETQHAIAGATDSGEDELVVSSVARPGYRIGDHLIRAAEVVLERQTANEDTD